MPALDLRQGPLGEKAAAHLLRRITFGASKNTIDEFAGKDVTEALNVLLQPLAEIEPPIDVLTGETWLPKPVEDFNSGENELVNFYKCWSLASMYDGQKNATEKLTFFLHTHLTAISSVIEKSSALYYQRLLLRRHSTGNLKMLCNKICYDNAMLILLDGRLNHRNSVNENFARELLELFTIGKGPELSAGDYTNYTEEDVKAAAKVLSGYINDSDFTLPSTDPDHPDIPFGLIATDPSGIAAVRHDAGVKSFSSHFGNQSIQPFEMAGEYATKAAVLDELDQLIEMIFSREATAKFICRKIYRYFVYYKITDQVEEEVINPLAEMLYSGNYELLPVFEKLFSSLHFFQQDNLHLTDDSRGAIIKSPLEITLGTLRFFDTVMPQQTSVSEFYSAYSNILKHLELQGIDLYNPLDVNGYDAWSQAPTYHRNWISPNFLVRRYQFPALAMSGLTESGEEAGFRINVVEFIDQNVFNPSDYNTIVAETVKYLLPEEITEERFNFFVDVLIDSLPMEWEYEWAGYKNTGDDMVVRRQLEKFFNAIFQSPEYQLG